MGRAGIVVCIRTGDTISFQMAFRQIRKSAKGLEGNATAAAAAGDGAASVAPWLARRMEMMRLDGVLVTITSQRTQVIFRRLQRLTESNENCYLCPGHERTNARTTNHAPSAT